MTITTTLLIDKFQGLKSFLFFASITNQIQRRFLGPNNKKQETNKIKKEIWPRTILRALALIIALTQIKSW